MLESRFFIKLTTFENYFAFLIEFNEEPWLTFLDDENMIIIEINGYALKTFVATLILKVIDNLIIIFHG